jgi:protein-tyrosine phosphatase
MGAQHWILGAAGLLSVAACEPAAPDAVTLASVSRPQGGGYALTWTAAKPGTPVDVFVASAPGAPAADRKQVADNDSDGAVALKASDVPASGRAYFYVQADGGRGVWVGERVLPLSGGRNFRDLGGYATLSGASVKWGQLYRSGVMNGLTEADNAYLRQLGITQVCDFRSTEERGREPTRWQAFGAGEYVAIDYDDSTSTALRDALGRPDVSGATVAAAMASLYGGMIDRFAPQYTDMFARLVAGKAPLAFNCSAGKDRTGIAAALVLSALGVPRATILEDYALSEKVVNYEAAFAAPKDAPTTKKPGPYDFIAKLPADVRAPLLRSDPAYLEAAFKEMEARHGSVEGYLEQRLGVDAADLATLRRLYLDPADKS